MRSSRMRFGSNLGIFAMEEEVQRQQELDNPVEAPVEDNANSLETDLLEAGEDHAEIEDVNEAAEDGLETVEALESLRLVVNRAGKAGGLDNHGAAAVRVALESLYSRVGMHVAQPTPALESFGGSGDRVRATVALESDIKGRIKAIWEKIKEMISRAIKWVVELFQKYFGGAEKLEKRAKALADRAGKTNGTPSAKTFKSKRLVEALHLSGKVPTGAGGAEALQKVFQQVYKEYPDYLAALEMIGKFEDEKEKFGGQFESLMNSGRLYMHFKTASKPSDWGVGDNGVVGLSEELPGGRAMVIELDPDSIEKCSAGVGHHDKNVKAPTSEDVPTLSSGDAKKVATIVYGVAGELKTARTMVGKMEKVKKDLISFGDKFANGRDDEGETVIAQEAMRHIRLAVKLVDKPFLEVNAAALSIGKSLCDQVEQSLGLHAEKKK